MVINLLMRYFKILVLLLVSNSVFCQFGKEMNYGFFAGGLSSKITQLDDMIVPPGVFSNYNLEIKPKYGFLIGGFLNVKYPEKNVSVQADLYFSKEGSDLLYDDILGLNYKLKFNYTYLNIGLLFKYYVTNGFYIGSGPYLGLNLNKDNLEYTSNSSQLNPTNSVIFEPDAVVQKVLKESFEGNDYFFVKFGTGYEFENHLTVGFNYNLGITDAVKTNNNGFRYTERLNKLSGFSLNIGYSFEFDDTKNFENNLK